MRNDNTFTGVIRNLINSLYRSRRLVTILAAIVVVVTTYSLILPALTLEKDKASQQGGIKEPEFVISS